MCGSAGPAPDEEGPMGGASIPPPTAEPRAVPAPQGSGPGACQLCKEGDMDEGVKVGHYLMVVLKWVTVAGFVVMLCIARPKKGMAWRDGLWAHVAGWCGLWLMFFVAWLKPVPAPLGAGVFILPLSDSLIQTIFELTLVVWPVVWLICWAAGTWGTGACWGFFGWVWLLELGKRGVLLHAAGRLRASLEAFPMLREPLAAVEEDYIPKPWYMELPVLGMTLALCFSTKGLRRKEQFEIPGEGHVLDLEIWRREGWETFPDAVASRPVVFFVHGGAWLFGNHEKHTQQVFLRRLALEGFIVVACSYRKRHWPTHLLDCAAGVGWTRDHIAQYGGDLSGGLVFCGASAGGHLVSLLTCVCLKEETSPDAAFAAAQQRMAGVAVAGIQMWYPALDPRDESKQGVAACCDEQLAATFFRCCVADRKSQSPAAAREDDGAAWEVFMPTWQIRRNRSARFPPVMILHGCNDSIVPLGHSFYFFTTLTHLREDSRDILIPVPYARHSFEKCPSKVHDVTLNVGVAWLNAVTGRHVVSTAPF